MQIDYTHDIHVVMPIYSFIEYSDNYLQTFGILWQYCRDKLAINADNIVDFNADNAANSFNVKKEIIRKTGNNDMKSIVIVYHSNI